MQEEGGGEMRKREEEGDALLPGSACAFSQSSHELEV